MKDRIDKKHELNWSSKFTPKSNQELKKTLTREQYKVVIENGTEAPFENEFWDNHIRGIYVDIISGEPLFSSSDKFDSGTGWPSFTRPIPGIKIKEKTDRNLGILRQEVRSDLADSHLGHVFNDGPTNLKDSKGATPTGKRYCLNSAALKFIPESKMNEAGYGAYLKFLLNN